MKRTQVYNKGQSWDDEYPPDPDAAIAGIYTITTPDYQERKAEHNRRVERERKEAERLAYEREEAAEDARNLILDREYERTHPQDDEREPSFMTKFLALSVLLILFFACLSFAGVFEYIKSF